MEIKMKEKLLMNNRFGAIKKIETMYRMMSKKFYVKRSADLSDLEPLPYEVTQKCKFDALEFERRQAQAIADAQKMRNFGMI
jgi:hypothetical protein